MEKIKNMRQLQGEKKRLNSRLEQIENAIGANWIVLKENLQPVNIASQSLSTVLKKSTLNNLQNESIVKNTFTFAISLMAKKMVNKVGGRLMQLFKK